MPSASVASFEPPPLQSIQSSAHATPQALNKLEGPEVQTPSASGKKAAALEHSIRKQPKSKLESFNSLSKVYSLKHLRPHNSSS